MVERQNELLSGGSAQSAGNDSFFQSNRTSSSIPPLKAQNTKAQGKVDSKYSVKQRVKMPDEIRFCNELKGKCLQVLINDQGHLELLCLSQQYMTGAAG